MEFDFSLNVSVSFCGLLMREVYDVGGASVEVSEEEEFECEA